MPRVTVRKFGGVRRSGHRGRKAATPQRRTPFRTIGPHNSSPEWTTFSSFPNVRTVSTIILKALQGTSMGGLGAHGIVGQSRHRCRTVLGVPFGTEPGPRGLQWLGGSQSVFIKISILALLTFGDSAWSVPALGRLPGGADVPDSLRL